MLIVHATLPVLADKREEFLGAAGALVEASNAEEGVLSYALFESVATPNEFVFMEHYADEDAFKAHMGSEHFGAAAQHLGGWLSGAPKIVKHEAGEGVEVPLG